MKKNKITKAKGTSSGEETSDPGVTEEMREGADETKEKKCKLWGLSETIGIEVPEK